MEWTKPEDLVLNVQDVPGSLGSAHNGNYEAVFADGNCISIPASFPAQQFLALATCEGKEKVDGVQLRQLHGPKQPVVPIAPDPIALKIRPIQDKLKSIAIAVDNYKDSFGSYPMSDQNKKFFDKDGKPFLSWRVHIPPFLHEKPLYAKFKLDESWSSKHNRELLKEMPDVFRLLERPGTCLTRVIQLRGEGTYFIKGHIGSRRPSGYYAHLFVAGEDKSVFWTQPQDVQHDKGNPIDNLGWYPELPGIFTTTFNGAVYTFRPSVSADFFNSRLMRVRGTKNPTPEEFGKFW